MLFITLVGLYYLDQKMLECGMQWEAVIKKLGNWQKHKSVMKEQNVLKTDKELLFIRWPNSTTQWALSLR
jgi:hypothetical protein